MQSAVPPSDDPAPQRIDAEEVARRVRAGADVLLVCAYDSPVAWGKFGLAGALPLQGLQEQLADLDPETEVVLYCRCPQDRTADRAARRLRAGGVDRVRVLEGGHAAALAAGLRPHQRR